jgi:hypothetical protein
MSEAHSKSPSARTTRPEGNTGMRPSALERGIGENVAAKLAETKTFSDQQRRMCEHLARKRTESGHARG